MLAVRVFQGASKPTNAVLVDRMACDSGSLKWALLPSQLASLEPDGTNGI